MDNWRVGWPVADGSPKRVSFSSWAQTYDHLSVPFAVACGHATHSHEQKANSNDVQNFKDNVFKTLKCLSDALLSFCTALARKCKTILKDFIEEGQVASRVFQNPCEREMTH